MAKVEVNTVKMNGALLIQANANYGNIKSALSAASSISPSDFGWSSITGKIDDCVNVSRKYVNWLSNINQEYSRCFTSTLEELEEIEVDTLKSSNFTVK